MLRPLLVGSAADLRVGALRAVVFFATAPLTAVVLAAVFLAVAFLATALLAAVFLVAVRPTGSSISASAEGSATLTSRPARISRR